jgi:hypothetical protein
MIGIISVQSPNFPGSLVTWWQRVLRMKYWQVNHTGIFFEMGGEVYISEMTASGNAFKPMSQYVGYYCEVLNFPADQQKAKEVLFDLAKTHIPYGFIDLAVIGVSMAFRRIGLFKYLKEFTDSESDIVCSNYPRRLIAKSGGCVDKIPPMLSPAELSEILGVKKSFVYCDKFDLME